MLPAVLLGFLGGVAGLQLGGRPALNSALAATAVETDKPATRGFDGFNSVVQKTYNRYPVTIDRGVGCVLYDDAAGREYLDFVAGIATCCLGHGDARLVKAVSEQIAKVHHVSNLYYVPAQGELAAYLVKKSPGMSRAFFCNSGAEANEAAIKLALKVATLKKRSASKPVVLTALGSFHGRTMATISATAQPKYHGPDGCWKLNDLFDHFAYNDIESLEAAFAKHDNVAAVLIEPVQGEGGVKVGDAKFFQHLRALCDKRGALLMFDEVQAGVGRTGKMWGHEHLSVQADVISCAKALGGGVPLGAMLTAAEYDVFEPGDHATTYGGNPLACAAGLAVARAIEDDGLMDNCAARGAELKAGLQALVAKYPALLLEGRGLGLLLGLELKETAPTAGEFVAECAKNGLLLVPAGVRVVRFVPPLVVTKAQVETALRVVEAAVKTFAH
ncbi:N-acetylornithine aminotransferase [Pelagophyceae sp. CCMP2097]|nr:N-acetylornithine aminotransferase [Pelagophyceae sp. CCMP2097]|mmetsp:Transcript_27890/g.93857  ORF Transcript_27890/g.93857 Transcript_27890/m.93857 type:complete len:445 (+) Transcript_27890:47-1381(+)